MHESSASSEAARLAEIWLYPIKSLTGLCVTEARLLPQAGLEHDRRWGIVDTNGRLLTQKRLPLLGKIRAKFQVSPWRVRLSLQHADSNWLRLPDETTAVSRWLTDQLGQQVHLKDCYPTGCPDDADAPGPTIVSRASLEAVADWFPTIDRSTIAARFRPNLIVEEVPAFWEDGLLKADAEPARFWVGEAGLWAVNACRRCVVPTRDPTTGEREAGFVPRFAALREQTLPGSVSRESFQGEYYRLTVNTRVAEGAPATVRVGDSVFAA